MQSLEETKTWIIKLYGNRLRKDGVTKVWLHSVAVERRLANLADQLQLIGFDQSLISLEVRHAALLHDALEDAPKLFDHQGKQVGFDFRCYEILQSQIADRCSPEILELVQNVTHPIQAERLQRYRALERRAQRTWQIPECLIKTADHLDNRDERNADYWRIQHTYNMLRYLHNRLQRLDALELFTLMLDLEGIPYEIEMSGDVSIG
ncbi:MAG: HD domain-containing protein [Candidatus Uhrbacteria bacterium]|nr:hypothetical protein [Patescibacteria group bacterium]MBU1907362.1 hypothetical protein [Patescibacteria group bacterium]